MGRNGRGKTTLMNILRGRLDYRGTVTTNLAFNYFPLTINDPTTFAGPALLAGSADRNLEQWQIERELGLMGVDPPSYGSLTKPLVAVNRPRSS